MSKHFEFADFVEEFKVPFVAYEKTGGSRLPNGEWVGGTETTVPKEGIILPLSEDDLKYVANGTYTEKDRKIYIVTPLAINMRVEYKGQIYTIQNSKPYEDYADVYIYYARGASK